MPIERMFETRRISVNRGYTKVLVKVVLFQLRGRGHPQGDPTPTFFPNSKGFLSGLSNKYHLFPEFLVKLIKNSKNVFLKTRGTI